MKRFDLPPVWLAGCLLIAWDLTQIFPQTKANIPFQGQMAALLFVAGLLLTVLAMTAMARAKTTIIPRKDPSALVTSGIFRFTRNPIYLGDLFFLGAGIMFWGSVGALPLLWLFPKLIERRYIEDEEAKMRAHFGGEYEQWALKTRRWL